MQRSDVTVVLPTKNESRNIRRFLASVPDDVALVVVDASDDDTRERIAAARPHACIVKREGNIALARQIGAGLATTGWLLFTDADVELAPGYFDRLERLGDGDVYYGAKLSRDEFCRHYAGMRRGQRMLAWLGIAAASGSNLLIRRTALAAVGGFDTRLPCNEDSEVTWRLQAACFRVAFEEDLVVFAFDHRRLRSGSTRKSWHSWLRCALLYTRLLPDRWRAHDWGYWAPERSGRSPVPVGQEPDTASRPVTLLR